MMRINGNPSATALQHMAGRAQEVRKATVPSEVSAFTAAPAEATAETGDSSASGNNVPVAGGSLPPITGPGHATGLARAIERLQDHVGEDTLQGLNNALKMLQRNLERSESRIDTTA